jgi:hypothetical protein
MSPVFLLWSWTVRGSAHAGRPRPRHSRNKRKEKAGKNGILSEEIPYVTPWNASVSATEFTLILLYMQNNLCNVQSKDGYDFYENDFSLLTILFVPFTA